jgi:hypothetical protein
MDKWDEAHIEYGGDNPDTVLIKQTHIVIYGRLGDEYLPIRLLLSIPRSVTSDGGPVTRFNFLVS